MNGWKYEWVGQLPQEVYDELVAWFKEEDERNANN